MQIFDKLSCFTIHILNIAQCHRNKKNKIFYSFYLKKTFRENHVIFINYGQIY